MALSQNSRGILIMLLAVFIFTSMDALVKRIIADYGTVQAIWARYTGQTVIVALILAPRLGRLLRTRYPGGHLARSLCQFGASACFFAGLGYVGLAEATAIMDVNPVLITLGAALFLGERLGPWRLFGVFAALAGALIVIRPGSGVFTPGALLPLAAAVFYAAYALLTRAVGRDEPVWTALLYTALAGTLISTAMLPWHWTPIASVGDGLALLAIGALGATAQLCLIRAFSLAEASVVAPFGYVGLIFATGWGFALFGEVPDGWTVFGATVIVLAGLLVWYRETRAARLSAGARPR
jgi:drug/metabolite transporter (DMT)-like permease